MSFLIQTRSSHFILAFFLFAFSTIVMGETLVPFESSWKYIDDGTDQGTAWRNPSFSDAGWKAGTAGFGYGARERTTLAYRTNASDKIITTYFRRSFHVSNPSTLGGLSLQMKGPGGVVYL